ncbi:MAG: tetraacyldisaccharide 4'-kinase [Pseudomonadota bacterium]|nr:tetraacyldisaccharide 4'-kinase [Pseudomonadota bacterium]
MILKFIENIWYKSFWSLTGVIVILMSPLSILYLFAIKLHDLLYKMKILRVLIVKTPVLIVGNLTVGGSGKTPFCIWLSNHLEKLQFKVGIVASGYKSNGSSPKVVDKSSSPLDVGDEAIELASMTNAIVVSSDNRAKSSLFLENNFDLDLIIHDDGLQNKKISRDIEILLINDNLKYGNGFLLPAGPLRELPDKRIQNSDLIVHSKCKEHQYNIYNSKNIPAFMIENKLVTNSISKESRQIDSFERIHLVCGISSTKIIEENIRTLNVEYILHKYSDHYSFKGNEILFDDNLPVFVTMKDYVKLEPYKTNNLWIIKNNLIINQSIENAIKKITTDIKKL